MKDADPPAIVKESEAISVNDLAAKIKESWVRFQARGREMSHEAESIGDWLFKIKTRIPGKFKEWVGNNLPFSFRHAQRLIQLFAEAKNDRENSGDIMSPDISLDARLERNLKILSSEEVTENGDSTPEPSKTANPSPKQAPRASQSFSRPAHAPKVHEKASGRHQGQSMQERANARISGQKTGPLLLAGPLPDDSEVTPHRCPACSHRWKGTCMPDPDPLPDFPKGLDTDAFRAAWGEWMAYRGERRLPKYKPKGFAGQMKQLLAMGEQKAIGAIEFSIAQNYQGIFDPHKNGKGKPPEQFETIKEWLQETQSGPA